MCFMHAGDTGYPSPLFYAAEESGGGIVRLLARAGMAPVQTDAEGLTPPPTLTSLRRSFKNRTGWHNVPGIIRH